MKHCNKILLAWIVIFFSIDTLSAQSPDILWTRLYSNFAPWAPQSGHSVQQTLDGGYVIAGHQTNSFYVIKTDPDGYGSWEKSYGGGCGYSVRQTPDAGYIIAGYLQGGGFCLIKTDSLGGTLWTKTYGEGQGRSLQRTSDGGYIIVGYTAEHFRKKDVYLIKTDSLGDTLWTKTYGGIESDEGHSVQLTTDGGYIIVGSTGSWGQGNADVYLIKTDSLGGTLWTKTYGGIKDDIGNSVVQTPDSGYIIVGTTSSFGAGNADVYLVKTAEDGDSVWTRTYGTYSMEEGNSIKKTIDGGYIIVGYKSSGNGVYFLKIDEYGDTLWSNTYGSPRDNYGYSVQQTSDDGYAAVGWNVLSDEWGNPFASILLLKTNPFSLKSPNGGEIWLWNQTHNVIWFCEKFPDTLEHFGLLLSLDGGSTYPDTIATNINSDSTSWEWQIPHIYSTTCRIKIQVFDSFNNLIAEDESDTNFSIAETSIKEEQSTESEVQALFIEIAPNPFSKVVSFKCSGINEGQKPNLKIYDLGGRLVKYFSLSRTHGVLPINVLWDGRSNSGKILPNGIYFIKLETRNHKETRKLLKLR